MCNQLNVHCLSADAGWYTFDDALLALSVAEASSIV